MPLATGDILAERYRVVKRVAQGGFGSVYRAWDLRLNAPCALKESMLLSPEVESQFHREASLLANLRHQYLPRVIDYFSVPGGGQYLVMDFVEGEDLDSMVQRQGKLSVEQTLNWISQICDALIYLHSQRPPIIHRDIKPANIRITPQGQAMLVDFGTAKFYDSNLQTPIGARNFTPSFSPIEQFGYGTTDTQSDIYSLGATCYFLLTGETPPESIERMMGAGLTPPDTYSPQVPLWLSNAIVNAMEIYPEQRYKSVTEFKAELASVTPRTSPIVQAIVVAPTGVAHYRSIKEAIMAAVPGARILVRPGFYRENLRLDRPVEIIGEGQVEEIILEATDADCILMNTENALIRGLTIRGKAGEKRTKAYAVDIPRGRLVLEDCDICNETLACIAVHGPDADPIIRRCRIHDSASGGIFIYKNAKGIIADCEIYKNARAGIAIHQGGNPQIRRCRIYEGNQSGIYIYDHGLGVIESCEIFGNSLTGIEIKEESDPKIFRCKINRNRYQAVYVHERGKCLVQDCDLTGNLRGAWYIAAGCQVQRNGNIE
jgi:parallel beta-helix repeat protein